MSKLPLPDSSLPWPIPMAAVALIAEREGLRLRAYRCPAGVWTCGWGETEGVTPRTVWTRPEADQRLLASIEKFSDAVTAACKTTPSPNQLGAATSLAYNIGAGAFAKSSVLRAHNRGDDQAAARAFALWNKARVNGVLTALPGLTARRAAEAALYLTPEAAEAPEPMPQAVQAESSVAASPIAQGGAATVGTGALVALSEAREYLGPVGDWFRSARQILGDAIGIPPEWVLPGVLLIAGAVVLRWRLQQRRGRVGVTALLGPALSVLRGIPVWVWVIVAALAWGGFQHRRAASAAEKLRTAQAAAAADEAQALRANIAETTRRAAAHEEIASAAQAEAETHRRAAAGARAAAVRVRDAAAAIAASTAASSPGAADGCEAAQAAGRLLADLLGRSVARAAELADHADRAAAAGRACEAAYDALRGPR